LAHAPTLLITTAEAARRLGVSRERVRQLLEGGMLAGFRIERRDREHYADLSLREGSENDRLLVTVQEAARPAHNRGRRAVYHCNVILQAGERDPVRAHFDALAPGEETDQGIEGDWVLLHVQPETVLEIEMTLIDSAGRGWKRKEMGSWSASVARNRGILRSWKIPSQLPLRESTASS